jgi:hypothetical protein
VAVLKCRKKNNLLYFKNEVFGAILLTYFFNKPNVLPWSWFGKHAGSPAPQSLMVFWIPGRLMLYPGFQRRSEQKPAQQQAR